MNNFRLNTYSLFAMGALGLVSSLALGEGNPTSSRRDATVERDGNHHGNDHGYGLSISDYPYFFLRCQSSHWAADQSTQFHSSYKTSVQTLRIKVQAQGTDHCILTAAQTWSTTLPRSVDFGLWNATSLVTYKGFYRLDFDGSQGRSFWIHYPRAGSYVAYLDPVGGSFYIKAESKDEYH